jgi:hypothetical protein
MARPRCLYELPARGSNSSHHGMGRVANYIIGALSRPASLAQLWHTLQHAGRPSGDASTHAEQLAAQKREMAAAKAVTTTLIDRGWAMLKRGHRLLDWFNRHSKVRE